MGVDPRGRLKRGLLGWSWEESYWTPAPGTGSRRSAWPFFPPPSLAALGQLQLDTLQTDPPLKCALMAFIHSFSNWNIIASQWCVSFCCPT